MICQLTNGAEFNYICFKAHTLTLASRMWDQEDKDARARADRVLELIGDILTPYRPTRHTTEEEDADFWNTINVVRS